MEKEIDFSKLKEPFAPEDIEWRIQSCGTYNGKPWARVLAYITNRAIQNRLDEVVGPQNWKNEFTKGPDGGVLCGISIKCDGEWITKYDGSENTDIEAVKGGLSSSMKRAASTGWGIGRYLYELKDNYAEITTDKKGNYAKTKDGTEFRWFPPKIPAKFLPKGCEVKEESNSEFEDIKNKLIDFMSAGIMTDEEADKTDGYIKDKNLKMMKAILDMCVNRYETHKKGA